MTPAQEARVARARNGDLVVFAVNGLLLASWLSRVPDIKQMLGLSPGQLGILLLAISVGAVIGLPMAGRIAHRFGAVRTVRAGMVLAAAGSILGSVAIEVGGPLPVIMVGLFLLGLGNGVWDVSQNLQGSVIEQALGRAIMPWFHAAFSIGTVLGALLGAAMTWADVSLALQIPVVAVVTAVAVVWGTSAFLGAVAHSASSAPAVGHRTEETSVTADPIRHRSPWTERRTLLIGVLVMTAAFTEGTANDWLAVAFVDGHDLSKALGVLALAVFLTFMTAGRIFGTTALDRYGRVPVLRVLFTAAIAGCVLVVLGGPWFAFVGAAIWGVGASLGFPVGMSAASDDPARAALRLSVVSTLGYTAFLAGPPLLGFLGDHFGVLPALLAVGAMSVLAILVAPNASPLPTAAGS